MSGTWDPCEPALRGGRPGLKKAMAGGSGGQREKLLLSPA